jgi:hypothetical protein
LSVNRASELGAAPEAADSPVDLRIGRELEP